jgi:hypothetical protein
MLIHANIESWDRDDHIKKYNEIQSLTIQCWSLKIKKKKTILKKNN